MRKVAATIQQAISEAENVFFHAFPADSV